MHEIFAQRGAAKQIYLRHCAHFPLIAAVLAGAQDGRVFADKAETPTQVYVEHAFGFAQIFGARAPAFEQALRRYLLIDRTFCCAKVRLYTPHRPDFLLDSACDNFCSWRQRFELAAPSDLPPVLGAKIVHAESSHLDAIDQNFGVLRRFWRGADDFLQKANAVLALVDDRPAALCYAAALADGRAEIDVLTLPAYQRQGLARAVVDAFSHRCLSQNVAPVWDCFTNNAGSMALCRAAGFVAVGEPYPFYTLNRS